MVKSKKDGYPQSRSFDMAPNAGVSEGRRIDAVVKDHGSMMDLSSKQHISENTRIHHWGEMPYSQEQHSNGSMDYMEHKMKIAASDAKKIKRPQKGVDNAS